MLKDIWKPGCTYLWKKVSRISSMVSLLYIFVKPGIVRYSIFYWNQYTIYFTADRNKTQNYYLSDHLFVKLEALGMNWLNETLSENKIFI